MVAQMGRLTLLLLLLLAALSGCSTPVTGTLTDLTITDRVDADGRAVRSVTTLPVTTQTVHAVAVLSGARPGARVQARWYLGGRLVQESDPLTLPDERARYVDFSLDRRGDRFPGGTYRVEVVLEGKLLSRSTFTVS